MNRILIALVGLFAVSAQAGSPTLDAINKGILVGRKTCDLRNNPANVRPSEIFKDGLATGQRVGNNAAVIANIDKGILVGEESCSTQYIPVALATYTCSLTISLNGMSMSYDSPVNRQYLTQSECAAVARQTCLDKNRGGGFAPILRPLCQTSNDIRYTEYYSINFGNGDIRPLP